MVKSENRNKITIFLIAAAVIFSFWFTGFSLPKLISRGSQFFVIIGKMFPPDTNYLGKIISPLLETIKMSFAGTFIGSLLALIVATFCAYNTVAPKWLCGLLKAVINILRAIPVLIIALAVSFIFGIGSFAGAFAIALYTFGIIARLTWKDAEQQSHKTMDALVSAGIGKTKAFANTVFIDIFPEYLSNCLYVLESNVRHAAILGYVGAGGLGLILNEKISWGDYAKVGMILIMLFIVVFIIETISSYLRRILNGSVQTTVLNKRIIFIVILAVALLSMAAIDAPQITDLGIKVFKGIIYGILHPDMSLIFTTSQNGVPYLMLETICIAAAGTFIGAVISVPLAFPGSRNVSGKLSAGIMKIFIIAIRTMPAVIYGLIFIRVTGPGAFAGVMTLGILSIGMCTKLYINTLDSFDMKTANALKSMGVSHTAAITNCILPEVKNKFFASAIYRFDVNLREASVLGLVSAGGIGTKLIFSMNGYLWSYAGAYILGLVILILLVDKLNSLIV